MARINTSGEMMVHEAEKVVVAGHILYLRIGQKAGYFSIPFILNERIGHGN
jgi:hypothetical protein